LIVFYTLLPSVSEHLNYDLVFELSALATNVLISGCVKIALKTSVLTTLIAGILATSYGFISVIIQLQDFTLQIGSIGILTILTLAIYFSRKTD
jgi:inner membrane protein